MSRKKQKIEQKTDNLSTNDEDKLFSDISEIAKGILGLAKTTVPFYKDFTDNVINERISDIKTIEWQLSLMLDFCFDDEILLLYKAVLRKLYDEYPETVVSYVQFYREMYEDEGIDNQNNFEFIEMESS